jgi:membrane protein DedA with SNARE-associated domain
LLCCLDLSAANLYSLGYLGIFALSLGASLIVFVPLPYLSVILAAALSGRFDPTLLAISSSTGSALAKMIIYQTCYSGQRIVDEKTKQNLTAFRTIFAKYAWIAVFIAASTPIPDDVVYVPLGFARYNRLRFFTGTLMGKTILALIIVYGATFLTNSVLGLLLVGSNKASTMQIIAIGGAFAAFTLLLTFFISRMDWRKWLEKHFPGRMK